MHRKDRSAVRESDIWGSDMPIILDYSPEQELTPEQVAATINALRAELASRSAAGGVKTISVGDLSVSYDVGELTRLIRYFEGLLANMQKRQSAIKTMNLGGVM